MIKGRGEHVLLCDVKCFVLHTVSGLFLCVRFSHLAAVHHGCGKVNWRLSGEQEGHKGSRNGLTVPDTSHEKLDSDAIS